MEDIAKVWLEGYIFGGNLLLINGSDITNVHNGFPFNS